MGEIHVFVNLGNWHDEVDIEVINYIDNEAEGNDEARVLKVGELNVHCAELNSPSDARILRWGRLEPE